MNLRVTVDGRTYEVKVEDIHARPVVALVAGERFEVWPEELFPQAAPVGAAGPTPSAPPAPAASAAPPAGAARPEGDRTIVAPIPGVIVALRVAPGDRVEVGQELCTLEAMKMKNSIRAARAGTVAAVRVAVGDQVRHGQPLIELAA